MAGFCEGCPVPGILNQLRTGGSITNSEFLRDVPTRKAVVDLVIALANQADCSDGPQIEWYDYEAGKYLLACQHPNAAEIGQVGDVVEVNGALSVTDILNVADRPIPKEIEQ
jgi:hypothetical protein